MDISPRRLQLRQHRVMVKKAVGGFFMRVNTVIKLGSLAFNVAQDEKVRELLTMVHTGVKRRGLLAPHIVPQNINSTPNMYAPGGHQAKIQVKHPIPFAPNQPPSRRRKPEISNGGFDITKHLTMNNAKKALSFAGTISNFLNK